MKAQVINLPVNNSTPSYDMIDRNWHDLTKGEDQEISEKLKRVMNIVKYLVSSKEYKKFTYPYFIKILNRSQDQVRRYFDEFEETGLGEIKFHKKLLRENGTTQWRCLDIKLTEKGVSELGLENRITPHTHAAYSHRTDAACYIDNNTDNKTKIKEDRSKRSDQFFNFSKNVAKKKNFSTNSTEKEKLPKRDSKHVINNVVPISSENDKVLSSFFPLPMEITHEIAKQAGRMEFSSNQIQDIANRISQKYPNKLIYRGKTDILIKYLASVVKNEKALLNPQQYYPADPGDAYLKYCQDLAEQIRIHGDSVLNYKY